MVNDKSEYFSKIGMHVMFVIPRFAAPGQFYNYPIGLACIYAFLKRHGVSVSCLNLCHEFQNTRVLLNREFKKHRVNIICTGGMSSHWGLIEDILVNAKLIDRNVVAVVGGPIVTADPELAMAKLPIDYGVIGEGEYTIIELLKIIQQQAHPGMVKGLIFKSPVGQLVLTEKREEISDLDSLPIPERQDLGFRDMMGTIKYAQHIPILEDLRYAEIIGSRSCPFSCTFCYHPLGKKYRQRSLDHIFTEIDYLHKTFGANVIAFNDELFSHDQARMLALAKRIKPYHIKWTAQFRVTNVQREVVEELVASGLIVARFGIESMNDEVLKSMEKHTNKADIINALDICRQAKLVCAGNIILGDSADTIETVNESITWWKKNSIYQIGLDFIRAVPDAPIYRLALERGLIKNKLAHVRNLPLINLSKMSDRQYYALVLKVCWWNLMCTYMTPGTLIATRRLDERFGNKHFYELKLRCPFCGNEQIYKRILIIPVPNMANICFCCFANFKISQKQAFPGDYSIVITARHMLIKLTEAYIMRFCLFRSYRHHLKRILNKILKPSQA